MATKTTARPKPKVTPLPGQKRITPKPTNAREHTAERISKWMGKRGWTKAVRGVYRYSVKKSEARRENRLALKEMRESAVPTWRQRVEHRRSQRTGGAGRGRAKNYCAGCGKAMSAEELRTHDCGPKPKAAKATAATAATQPAPAAPPAPVAAPQAPQAPPAAPSDTPATPAPTRRQRLKDRLSGKAEMPTQPIVAPAGATVTPIAGSKPAPPPATAGANNNEGSPQMAWGSKSGNGNGASAAGGGSSGAASSATVGAMLTPWTAWAQNVPKTHIEMVAELEAMNQLMVAIGQTIRERQARMINMGSGPNGEQIGFHPTCVQQLNGAADQISAAGAYFTATHVAITAHYQALIQHYQGGTPDPGRQYLSNAS
jgi:hypothetical protein